VNVMKAKTLSMVKEMLLQHQSNTLVTHSVLHQTLVILGKEIAIVIVTARLDCSVVKETRVKQLLGLKILTM